MKAKTMYYETIVPASCTSHGAIIQSKFDTMTGEHVCAYCGKPWESRPVEKPDEPKRLAPDEEAAAVRRVLTNPPEITAGNPADPLEEWRMSHECKVCQARPDDEGVIRHGKGCYVVDGEGGGEEMVDTLDEQRERETAAALQAELEIPCTFCHGLGHYGSPDRQRCWRCDGSALAPTPRGEAVLGLVRRHLRAMLDER
jgi:hypothetical protein